MYVQVDLLFLLQIKIPMPEAKYKKIQNYLKEQIQQGKYKVGDYLPSENELCGRFSITRTTARKALDELMREGFIEKHHGKGSKVRERRKSLGLLNVKGFSEAVGDNVTTVFLEKPQLGEWSDEITLPVNEQDKRSQCIYFERLRYVGSEPVMLERNWFPAAAVPGFINCSFKEGSFFKTLSQKYLIEITGSKQELRAEYARRNNAGLLKIRERKPLLHISMKFFTTTPKLNIYSELFCVTSRYPVGNSYFL